MAVDEISDGSKALAGNQDNGPVSPSKCEEIQASLGFAKAPHSTEVKKQLVDLKKQLTTLTEKIELGSLPTHLGCRFLSPAAMCCATGKVKTLRRPLVQLPHSVSWAITNLQEALPLFVQLQQPLDTY